MGLPRAIQQQVEDADALVAQLQGVDPNTGEPINQPVAEPEPQPISPEPKPTPAPSNVTEETWERKYHTLKGMYDAEVPRMHAQIKELNTQVQSLIAEAAAAKATTPAPTPAPAKPLITEQDKEAFGSDLLDLIDRATEQKVSVFRDREAQLQDEIKELKARLGNVNERVELSDQDRYTNALTNEVPDWKVVNVDEGFLAWLQEFDPIAGVTRHQALAQAHQNMQAQRVAAIFKAYKALTAQPAPSKQNQELQRQQAPTRSRASAAPAAEPSNTKIWSQAEISRFYDDWRRGFVDEQEAERIQREIDAAVAEGRVR